MKRTNAFAILPLLRYGLFQGMLYMNGIERLHRLMLQLIVTLLFLAPALLLAPPFAALIIAIIAGHAWSALFNGHLFALLGHHATALAPKRDWQGFVTHIERMKRQFEATPPKGVTGILVFGSLARQDWSPSSDLDVRMLAKDGFQAAFLAAHAVFLARSRALFSAFPIDIYMCRSGEEMAAKIDLKREQPVLLFQDGTKLEAIFERMRGLDAMSPAKTGVSG